MHTKRILKFGGSSLADAGCFRRVEAIIRARIDQNPLVVVSALGACEGEIKITDSLKEAGLLLLEGKKADSLITAIIKRHEDLMDALSLGGRFIDQEKLDLLQTADDIARRKITTADEALDALMGAGEILSSKIMSAFLATCGLPFSQALPGEFEFTTCDKFGNANILESSLEKIAARVIQAKDLLVFPGYVGLTADGRKTTLGRGGSDYTAAILGAALKKDVEIWTDVDGIYRIAPRYMPEQFQKAGHPETIPELSYEEAFQMAAFGSRVLFEKAMHAVEQAVKKGKHIRLIIKNTFNPGHEGTVISSMHRHTGEPRGITCLDGTQLFNCYPQTPDESQRFRQEIQMVEGIHILLASETLGRISLVLDGYSDELTAIEARYNSHLSRDQVLVKIVGDGLGENSVTLSRIHNALQAAENLEKYGMTIVHKSPQLLTDTTFEFLAKKRGLMDVLLMLYKDLFMEKKIAVGLMGLGTVGKGVVDYTGSMYSAHKGGFSIRFPAALVRDPGKTRSGDRPIDPSMTLTTDADHILSDPTVDIVCEVMGGIEPARTYILEALKRGKDVVTANKALLAEHGIEIFQQAFKYRRNIGFEASVCGEIPIIDDLLKFPGLGDIVGIEGIVNGTSNYVLTRFMEGMPIDEAIKLAQEKGFAEADPFLDISGTDASQKLSILASILFNQPLKYREIPRQGLEGLLPVDRTAFLKWSLVVKPLAIARLVEGELVLRVSPALVPENHSLAPVRDENNALALYLLGRSEPITNIGKGAGAIPTARSVLRDILDVSRRSRAHMVSLPGFFNAASTHPVAGEGSFRSPWYLRLTVLDEPGVFGTIATVLGNCGLSLKRVLQEESAGADELPHILLELKQASFGDVKEALDRISKEAFVKGCFLCPMV